jgi:hypothetical protein
MLETYSMFTSRSCARRGKDKPNWASMFIVSRASTQYHNPVDTFHLLPRITKTATNRNLLLCGFEADLLRCHLILSIIHLQSIPWRMPRALLAHLHLHQILALPLLHVLASATARPHAPLLNLIEIHVL